MKIRECNWHRKTKNTINIRTGDYKGTVLNTLPFTTFRQTFNRWGTGAVCCESLSEEGRVVFNVDYFGSPVGISARDASLGMMFLFRSRSERVGESSFGRVL